VDEDVEPAAERVADLREHARKVVVGADIALRDERAVDGRREVAHVLLDALALVRERNARALRRRGRFAIAHAIDRWFATPRTSACFPSNLPAMAAILNG
jgi:hypothetical protein